MSEEQNKQASSDADKGNISSEISRIEELDAKLKRLEETEKRVDGKIGEYTKLMERNLLSGRSEVFIAQPVDPEKQRKENLKAIYKGTELEGYLK